MEEGGEDDCALDQMLVVLQNAGYDTQPYKLHAQDYVLPQGRKRVFMLGIRRPAKHIAVESYDQLFKDINNWLREMQHMPPDLGDVLLPPTHNPVTHVLREYKGKEVKETWGSNSLKIHRVAWQSLRSKDADFLKTQACEADTQSEWFRRVCVCAQAPQTNWRGTSAAMPRRSAAWQVWTLANPSGGRMRKTVGVENDKSLTSAPTMMPQQRLWLSKVSGKPCPSLAPWC